ncbi:polysaccharide biosynthesis tyrosine autokinase [Oscillatoria sp. CS-180]|uniref:GumC family protein n=1 Tax=Oscillatoria sp. CS-180 TaxID=3021720 RepID=UPI0023312BB7|nr:polysaccharide biosynthesis tyrosine autokinase [Oscillatoria sp. CS-180]MDB9524433.1 polysaccharide biosynthesis tyrosine autokinase [Oscillatoria sp. CS-180]
MDQKDYQNYKDYIEQIDLQRYWLVLKRRWLPATALALLCVLGAGFVAMRMKGGYKASGRVFIQRDRTASLIGIGQELSTPATLDREANILETQRQILQATPLLTQVIETLDLRNDEGNLISPNALRSDLTVESVPGTNILEVSYVSANPERSAAVVNTLMDAFIEKNVENNRSEARAAREFIEDQLPTIRDGVDRAAAALRDFKVRNDIVNLAEETQAVVGFLQGVEGEAQGLETQLAAVASRSNTLRDQLNLSAEEAQDLVKLNSAESVQEVLTSLGEVQTELAVQGATYTENHPIVSNLRRQQDALVSLLNERVSDVIGRTYSSDVGDYEISDIEANLTAELLQVEAERQSIEESIRELEQAREEYIERSAIIPTLEKEELELVTDLETAQRDYDLLVSRLQEVRLTENQTLGTVQIQEQATPPANPVSDRSRQMKLILAGIGAGVLSGIALAFLLDLLDKSVKTAKDAEALLGYTLLGVIPKFGTGDSNEFVLPTAHSGGISPRVVTLTGTQPIISSGYQMLQANLKFIRSDHPLRMFVVTSSVAQEGKTEVCANLAVSMAQVGRRVLLIDADMRSPSQHHIWNVLNRVGLSHVLVGEGELEEALQPVAENVTLLPAGVVPPNPLALVDSERMANLMQQLSTQYDYVILDSPPLIGAADAAILGKMADGVLMVVRPRHVDSASVLAAKSLLSRAEADVLGFVANGINVNNEHDDYVSMTRSRFDWPGEEAERSLMSPKNKQGSIGVR